MIRTLGLVVGAAALLAIAGCQDQATSPQNVVVPPSPPAPEAMIETTTVAGAPAYVKMGAPPPPPPPMYWQPANTSKFPDAKPNPVKVTAEDPVSTFSIDVDTASYGVVRDALNNGALPPADAVRIEEMVNYFDYAYPGPKDRKAPFEASVRVYPTPWNKDTKILHIGIKGFDLPKKERPRANLVFLIDTSGSMAEPNKLPLLIRSFRLLVDQLKADDSVAIVTYAGSVGVVLEPTPGSGKAKIMAALDQLQAGGSTAGGEGIRIAYQLAKNSFIKGAVNRVLLATDGDFNVGITDSNSLEDFVTRERDSGVYLTCLGFGNDNYQDERMQKLAQAGNGNAAFIDNMNEARKVFVDQISGTLFTIANDVKIQVEFNPARVAEYRLIGYETRLLNRTDFNNDKVDAGDIGSGTTVTALYEITPVGSKAQMSDPLRYGKPVKGDPGGEYAFLKIRYKLPGEKVSKLIDRPIGSANEAATFAQVSEDMRFAASVVGAAQLLRHDPYIKDFDYDRAIDIANAAKGKDEFGYRSEFVQLLRLAKVADSQKPLSAPGVE
ncbi:MAG: VWA domain-containing protein [Alphaproteobacteria bacterium]|nr:VWA domain-containing protein [Alphaproteobacteria bacterium]